MRLWARRANAALITVNVWLSRFSVLRARAVPDGVQLEPQ
jgi:hypothetical protein